MMIYGFVIWNKEMFKAQYHTCKTRRKEHLTCTISEAV